MPEIFEAKNYITRQDLEAHISSKIGQGIQENKSAGHIIRGSEEELKQLQLSDKTSIWGVKCEMVDSNFENELKEKLKRKNKQWKI